MQRAKLNDQRGLISEQVLELPDFLKLDNKKLTSQEQSHSSEKFTERNFVFKSPQKSDTRQNLEVHLENSNNNSLKSPHRLLHNIGSPSTPLYSLQNISMPNFTPPPPISRDSNT